MLTLLSKIPGLKYLDSTPSMPDDKIKAALSQLVKNPAYHQHVHALLSYHATEYQTLWGIAGTVLTAQLGLLAGLGYLFANLYLRDFDTLSFWVVLVSFLLATAMQLYGWILLIASTIPAPEHKPDSPLSIAKFCADANTQYVGYADFAPTIGLSILVDRLGNSIEDRLLSARRSLYLVYCSTLFVLIGVASIIAT